MVIEVLIILLKNLLTGKGEITSQNHGFAINREEAEANENVEITHVHLNDHTVAGIRIKDKNVFLYNIIQKLVLDHMILNIYLINL